MTHVQNSKDAGSPRPASAEQNRSTVSRGTILLVEDNSTNQRVARYALKALGYHVVTAGDGRSAVTMFKRHRFDLILMDCHMPVMDGYEATRRIRQLESETISSPVPIIAVTADVLSASYDLCFEVGMNDFLAKPYEISELKRVIHQWLPENSPIPAS